MQPQTTTTARYIPAGFTQCRYNRRVHEIVLRYADAPGIVRVSLRSA